MGVYENEYRKYYSDIKARMNIKEENKEEYLESDEYNKIGGENRDCSMDVYPKKYNEYDELNEVNNKYLSENTSTLTKEQFKGTYRGIDSYNNVKGSEEIDIYSGRNYYRYNGGGETKTGGENKNVISKFANKLIFQLAITFVLFVAVITMKSIPNEGSKEVYAACKEAINKKIDYKEFVEDIKNINIIDEVNKIKVNLKLDDALKIETNAIKDEGTNTENVDD